MTDRSAEELERDAERIRSGIANTAEELKYRMQPGNVVDEMTRYLRDSDSSIALDNLRRQARDNPMALALIGAGVAWLIFGSRYGHGTDHGHVGVYDRESYGDEHYRGELHGGYDAGPSRGSHGAHAAESYAAGGTGVGYVAGGEASGSSGSTAAELREKAREAAARAGAAGRDYASRVQSAGRDYGYRASEAAEGVTGRVRGFVHDARDRVRDWSEEAGSRVRDLADHAGERWQGVSDRGRHWVDRGGYRMRDRGGSLVSAIEREPFLAGAIGLAIGAALGTMLPKARFEEETWPEAREQVRRGAGRAFDYASERARDMAQDVYEAGRAAAEREGLVPSDNRPLAERVGNVARAAADAAVEDTEREADRARDAAGGSGTTAGSGSSASSGGIPGAGTVRPKSGTDDLSARAATERRDTGPGST